MVPWRYIADDEQLDARDLLANGPIVVRPSRGSGGTGIASVEDAEALAAKWPKGEEFFASVSPYLPGCLPMNVGGVVWEDGVTVHLPSVQLIGIPECVGRQFGYCGNDFGAARNVESKVIDEIERITHEIGHWMQLRGYRGAFGIDFMVQDGIPLFTEVNPRFQGSTRVSAQLSREMELPCVLLDHIAAMLKFPCPSDRPTLRQLVNDCPPRAHIVIHNTSRHRATADVWQLTVAAREITGFKSVDVDIDPELVCEPNAVVAGLTFGRDITTNGFSVHDDLHQMLSTLHIFRPCSLKGN